MKSLFQQASRRVAVLGASDFLWLLAFFYAGATVIFSGFSERELMLTSMLAAAFSLLVFFSLGLYGRETIYSEQASTARLLTAGVIDFTVFYFALVVGFKLEQGGRAYLSLFVAVMAGHAAVFAARLLFLKTLDLPFMRRALLVIGCGTRAMRFRRLVEDKLRHEVLIVGHIPGTAEEVSSLTDVVPQTFPAGTEIIEIVEQLGVDEVVVAMDDQRGMPVDKLLRCKTSGLRVRDDVMFLEEEVGYIDTTVVTPGWFVFRQGFSRSNVFLFAKRGFDMIVSLMVLIFTLPITLIVAILIRCESRGPVFYRQERVGLNGEHFTLIKFRSMRVDAEKDGPQWASKKDNRTTRIGSILRRSRIDEIPQVLNVLRGDMSFVGPRPERPVFVDELVQQLRFYKERHSVKPGITGWAQINYPYGASIDDAREKLSFDLYYVKNASVFLDLLILIQTVRVVLFPSGAR